MSDQRSPEEIERDIQKTRDRLAADLDELSYRVSPEGLRDRAETGLDDLKDVALGATQDALRGVTDRAEALSESFSARLSERRLPLSLLGAAFGVGWLLVNAAKESSRERRAAPIVTPGTSAGTGRIVDAAGETVSEPEQKPAWLVSAGHSRPSTQTLLGGAAALLTGAAVGALLPGRDAEQTSQTQTDVGRDSGLQTSDQASAYRAAAPQPQRSISTERVPTMPPVETDTNTDSSAPAPSSDPSSDPTAEGFRRHYETTFGASGRDYAYFEPAYIYGSGLPSAPMHRSRTWDEAAEDAQRDWERSHSEPWEEVRDAVHQGWEHGLESRDA